MKYTKRMKNERFIISLKPQMANAWILPGWHGPLARPAGLPARLSGAGRTGGKQSPLAKRAPHPFRPAGRRTVRATGPCHPGFQTLDNALARIFHLPYRNP